VLVSARHTVSVIFCSLLLLAAARPHAAARPDATVLGLSSEDTNLRPGAEVSLAVQVGNAGTEALASVPVTLSVDGVPRAEWHSPPELQAGETATWKVAWTAASGEHVVTATIDPLNDVREPDETNNAGSLTLVVAPPASFPWAALGLGAIGLALGFWGGMFLRRAVGPPSARQKDLPPEG